MEQFTSSSSESCSSEEYSDSWIKFFTNLAGNDFLTQVPHAFIKNKANLLHLENVVENLEMCLNTILDVDSENVEPLSMQPPYQEHSTKVYALIHGRFVNTPLGILKMLTKYENGEFGVCPRLFCDRQNVLPIGLHDQFGIDVIKLYCPRCRDIFVPKRKSLSKLDGAFFGKSFPHSFFMQLPQLRPEPSTEHYEPSLYGFQVAPSAYEPLSE